MKTAIVSQKVHGVLDYASVVFLWIAPSLFDFSPAIAKFTYALGAIHLTLTIFTKFPLGLIRVVPMKIHSCVELVVSFVLIIAPWFLGVFVTSVDRIFYCVFGLVLLGLWFLTDYASGS